MKIPKKMLIRLLSSYMAIILLLIFINFFVNSKTENLISRQILTVRNALFTQQQIVIDEELKEYFRIVSSLSEDKGIISYADYIDKESGEVILLASSIQNLLKDAIYMNESISDIYIYFKKSGRCLSAETVTDGQGVFARYHSEFDSFHIWQNFMQQTYSNEIGYLSPENTDTSLLYTHTIKASGEDKATVVILLNKNFLNKLKSTQNETILILGQKGLCFTSGEKFPFSYSDFPEEEGRIEKEIDGTMYSVAYKQSSIARLQYLSVFNVSDFWEDFDGYRKLFLICLLLFLVLGGAFTVYYSGKNYRPIKKMLNIIPKTSHSNTEKADELMLIENALQKSVYSEKKQKEQQINSLLLRLLQGKTQYGTYEQKILLQNDISFPEDSFIVALFYIDDYKAPLNDFEEKSYDEEKMFRFAIKNIMNELLGERFITHMIDVDDLTVGAIVNHTYQNAYEDVSFIRRKAEKGLDLIFKELGIRCFCAISMPSHGIAMLPKAFSEAENVYEYKITMEFNAYTLCYSEIEGADSIYNYSVEEEKRLKNLIAAGNSEEAIDALHSLLRENTEHKRIANEVLQCLKFSLLNAILQEVSQDKEFIDKITPVQRLSAAYRISDIVSVLENILQEVCVYIRDKNNVQSQKQLSSQIKEYIQQNYMSMSLNVNKIGDVFKMTPYYISKKFRDETGESLLEYISEVRLEEAKRLLLSGEKTVEQIANEVGYTSSVTFNRLFKKAEGISPGEYRKKKNN